MANPGLFSIATTQATGAGWRDSTVWNILSASIGNILGGAIPVTEPLSWPFR